MTQTNSDSTSVDKSSLQEMIDGYFRCWNATETVQRRAEVEAVWASGARSIDPLVDATGHEELSAMFGGFHDTYVGHSFRQVGSYDTHHQLVRWGWEMVGPDGSIALNGIDVALLDDSHKITYLAGFFGIDLPTPV